MKNRLYRIEDEGKFGFIDTNGNIIIDFKYDFAYEFGDDGLAWVNIGGNRTTYFCDGGKWGLINEKEDVIIDFLFELSEVQKFWEGLAWIKIGNNKYRDKWSLIDKEGTFILKNIDNFDSAFAFCNGVAIIEKDKKKGCIDKTGKIIIEPMFDSITGSSDEVVWVNIGAVEDYDGFMEGGKWGLINLKGEYIKDLQYENINYFYNGVAWVKEFEEEKWGLIDLSGAQILDFKYDKINNFYHNEALVLLNSQWVIIDKNGAILKKFNKNINSIKNFDGKTGSITINDKYGYVNNRGQIILDPIYDEIKDSVSVSWVKTGDSWKLFNKKSKKLIDIELNFDYPEAFHGDSYEARIWLKNKCGLVNKNGETLAEVKYNWAGYHRNGYTWVNIGGSVGYSGLKGGKWGVIDTKENFIVKLKFDYVWDFWYEELLDIEIKKRKGYANRKGQIVWIQKK